MDSTKHYAKVEIESTDIYRKTDDCVFPYICDCEDCLNGLMWGAKHISMTVDNDIFINALKNYREMN